MSDPFSEHAVLKDCYQHSLRFSDSIKVGIAFLSNSW